MELIHWIEDWDGSCRTVIGTVVRSTYCMLVVVDEYGFEHYLYRWEITDRRKLYD